MCGRYALAEEHEALRLRYGFVDDPDGTYHQVQRYNIAPTQTTAIITNGEGLKVRAMRWGLIPHWAKDPAIGNSLINARSETASEKPSFRDSFRSKRCLVPATGFYEWKKVPGEKRKQPVYIKLRDQEIFSFAGLWSSWFDPKSSSELLTYTILTTDASDFMKEIHHRMPVILTPETERTWLDLSTDGPTINRLFAPYPADRIEAYPVGLTVNSPRNDSPDCLAPL